VTLRRPAASWLGTVLRSTCPGVFFPTFAGVAVIRRGRRRIVFVPLRGATLRPASITVTCGKLLARRAPSVRPGKTLPGRCGGGPVRPQWPALRAARAERRTAAGSLHL